MTSSIPADGTVIIVGASLAGLNAARKLRECGFRGRVTIVGDEPDLPYDRPPLSKQVLSGEWTLAQTALDVTDLDVTWQLGHPATGLDAEGRTVTLGDGSTLSFDGLVIATGTRPRTLPGFDQNGVFELRTLGDAARVRAALTEGHPRVVIIGAGFIGAEIASTARSLDLDVSLIEADLVPFRRILGTEVGAALSADYQRRGVAVHAGVVVDDVIGGDTITALRLTDGTTVPADLVVVAIGVVPNTEWLAGSGLPVDNGVVCQPNLTVAPGIVAAGDVARWDNPRLGESRRVEHWENAIKMAEHAAEALLDEDTPAFETVPWVWSDQFGTKFQFVGSTLDYDEVELVDDLAENGRLLALYRRGDQLIAACGVKRNKDVLMLRNQIGLPGSWKAATTRLLGASAPVAGAAPATA